MKAGRQPYDDQPRVRIAERRNRRTVVIRVLGSPPLQERSESRAVRTCSIEYRSIRRPQATVANSLTRGQSFGAFDGSRRDTCRRDVCHEESLPCAAHSQDGSGPTDDGKITIDRLSIVSTAANRQLSANVSAALQQALSSLESVHGH